MKYKKGFTLIELLVVIAIIALISSVIAAAVTKAKVRARDSQRIQNARQLSLALEQYEQSKQTYKIAGSGYGGEGYGYVAKGADEAGYSNSIVSALKADGYYSSINLKDPIYGLDNYYLGLCTSTGAYNIFVKLEQEDLTQSSTTISTGCGGTEAAALGFNYVAAVIGGNVGGVSAPVSGGGGGYVAAVGDFDTSFLGGSGPAGLTPTIQSITVQSDGKILIGGNFTDYNGELQNRITRLNSNGSYDTSFNSGGAGANSVVYSIIQEGDGKIDIFGTFSGYNGITQQRVSQMSATGVINTNYIQAASGTTGSVYTSAMQSDGKILIAGALSAFKGVTRGRIARINTDGTNDSSFNPGTGANGNIWSLALQSDGKILIVGDFTMYGTTTRNRIARINTDGSLDTSFDPIQGFNTTVKKVVVQPSDGKIIAAGAFATYRTISRGNIARINTDATIDTSFAPNGGTLGTINSIVLQPSGSMFIGGSFTDYDGVSRRNIAKVKSDGTLDTSFVPTPGTNGTIWAMAEQADGKILLGGDFTLYNGAACNKLIRIK